MCLTQSFWEEANKEAIKYEKRGYKFLAGIMDELDIYEDVLYNLKWVKDKIDVTTADIYEFELTAEGRKFLKYKKQSQLFIFKKNKFKKAFELLSKNNQSAKTTYR